MTVIVKEKDVVVINNPRLCVYGVSIKPSTISCDGATSILKVTPDLDNIYDVEIDGIIVVRNLNIEDLTKYFITDGLKYNIRIVRTYTSSSQYTIITNYDSKPKKMKFLPKSDSEYIFELSQNESAKIINNNIVFCLIQNDDGFIPEPDAITEFIEHTSWKSETGLNFGVKLKLFNAKNNDVVITSSFRLFSTDQVFSFTINPTETNGLFMVNIPYSSLPENYEIDEMSVSYYIETKYQYVYETHAIDYVFRKRLSEYPIVEKWYDATIPSVQI